MSTEQKGQPPCTPAENSHPADSVPCVCRACGGTLEAKSQLTGLPDKPTYWFVTCWNPACALNGYTRSAASYPTFDLTPYLVKESVS